MVLLSLLSLAAIVQAADVHHHWRVSYAQANPDGLLERRVIGVNGTWPPPPLEVEKGDKLFLHVTNDLDVPTAVHHHGMFFFNASYYDGAVGVTQCPIPAGAEFTYEVETATQSGTYWAHSHFSGQYVDGFRTILNILDPEDVTTYGYDEDITIVLGDWYHDEHPVLEQQFMSIANPGGAEPVPNAALMYFSTNGTWLPGFNDGAQLNFQPGRTYRLRVVNQSALAMFWFWIDGHQLEVIEVDGTEVEPAAVDIQSVSVAQRYSFRVRARNDTDSNWLIHANMDPDMFDFVPDDLRLNITSTIVYDPNGPTNPDEPLTTDTYANTIDDPFFVPIKPVSVTAPDVSISLNAFFDTFDNGVNRAAFENITYNTPLVPSLLTALTMGEEDAVQNVAYGPTATVLEYEKMVELQVFNWDAGNHPFHLHGHKFALVWKSHDVTSDDPEINPPFVEGELNENPLWRDTVHIPSGGAVRVRFFTDNPGAWFFHCHIDWHLTSGLAWTFIEAPLQMRAQGLTVPQFIKDQCSAMNLPVSGNAAGHDTADDWAGLPLGPYPQKTGWTPKAIGAMFACVFSATAGMASVVWYALTGRSV